MLRLLSQRLSLFCSLPRAPVLFIAFFFSFGDLFSPPSRTCALLFFVIFFRKKKNHFKKKKPLDSSLVSVSDLTPY
jgi:hypothetical protein